MSTSKDVARLAGVSRATVSAVINQNKYVSPELRGRVLWAIKELNYQPNAIARSLKTKKTRTLGLIIASVVSPFSPGVIKGIEDTASRYGYNIILCDNDEKPYKEKASLEILCEKQVEGIILIPSGDENRDYISGIMESGMPVVLLDRTIDGLKVDSVTLDNEDAAYQAVHHLISLGYKTIGVICLPLNITTGIDRLKGYKKALAEAGIDGVESLIKLGDFSEKSGYKMAMELIEAERRPEALFVCNHAMALGALEAIKEKGLRIPDDIALVGFDDSPWAAHISPPLTTVIQPLYDLGASAVKLLLKRIKRGGNVKSPKKVALKAALIKRESCGWRKRIE